MNEFRLVFQRTYRFCCGRSVILSILAWKGAVKEGGRYTLDLALSYRDEGKTQVTIFNQLDLIITNLHSIKGNYKQLWIFYKVFSNRDIRILSINKTQKYLRYWVQIYCGCSASITFYEWNSISVIWPPRALLQRSILWTQFSTTLTHISTGTLAISRWLLSFRSSKVAGLLALVMGHRMKTSIYRKDNIDVTNKHRYRKKISIIVILNIAPAQVF